MIEFFKNLWARFFSKKEPPRSVQFDPPQSPPPEPPKTPTESTGNWLLDNIRRQQRENGYNPQAPQGVAPDNTGPDISDGAPHPYRLADGESKTVTFNHGGIVRVIGYGGTELLSVTDHLGTRSVLGDAAGYERSFGGAGSYTFSVKSIGGNVAVSIR